MNRFLILTYILFSFYGLNNVYAQIQKDSIPSSSSAIINRGIELFDNGTYEDAIEIFKQVSLYDPNYSKACYETALAYDNLGKGELALQKCQEALDLEPENVQFSVLRGSILDELGRFDEAITCLETLEKKNPFNQNLLYNLAVCYINKKEYEKAELLLLRGLHFNPSHTSSHIALGKINYIMGRKAQAFLAYNMGLIMYPRVDFIKTLEDAISGKNDSISKSYRYPYPANVNHSKWDDLTGLLNAEVAFRDDFPYNYKQNFLNSRQTFMLFQKMRFDEKDTTLYNQFYVRFFRSIVENEEFETFLNYTLKNTDNKLVAEWLDKNKVALDKFIKRASQSINSWKEYGFSTANEALRQKKYHFNDNGKLESVGVTKENSEPSREGLWNFISETGSISEKGYYKNDLREGEFLVFWPNGKIKQKLNYLNDKFDGPNFTYHLNGARSGFYPRKKGIADGVEEEFNSASNLVSRTQYKDGKIEGNAIYVDYAGGFRRDVTYSNNRRSGIMTEKWLNSNKKIEANYVDSLLNGSFRKWYANGQPEWEGVYEKNTQVGKWISYYANGTKSAEGEFDETGKPTGAYSEFDHQGKLIQHISEYKDGKPNGIQIFYFPDGKESVRLIVEADVYKHIECFNPSGDKIYSADEKDGELIYKSFFPEGALKTEGKFKNGAKDGIWKNYNVLGRLKGEESWSNGMRSGLQKAYYANGNPQLVYSCDSDKIVGKVTRFYSNGYASMIGYYGKNGPTGEWTDFYRNDSVEYRYYYDSGKLVGRRMGYSPEGKLKTEETFNSEGENTAIKYVNRDGKLLDDLNFEYGSSSFTLHFPNGKIRGKIKISDRRRDGLQEFFFPNGQLKSQQTFISGNAQGKAIEWDHEGKLIEVRNYCINELDGEYLGYENGRISVADCYEMGNTYGLYKEFHPNGKLFRQIQEEAGNRQGYSDCFAPDSTWMYGTQYRDDELCFITYLDNQGKLHKNESVSKSTREIMCYYKNGNVAARLPLSNCIFNGKNTIYYPNGQPLREIDYVNDYREGQSKYYYETGKIKEICTWLNGARQGHYTSFYANGQTEMDGEYLSNKKHGKWLVYNEMGKLNKTLYYEDDELYEIN